MPQRNKAQDINEEKEQNKILKIIKDAFKEPSITGQAIYEPKIKNKQHFKAEEDIQFSVPVESRSIITGMFTGTKETKAKVYNAKGVLTQIKPRINERFNSIDIEIPTSRNFKPGFYTIEIDYKNEIIKL